MIDSKKIISYIKKHINPYGKPFEGTVFEFGCKVMDYIEAMEKQPKTDWIPYEVETPKQEYETCWIAVEAEEELKEKGHDVINPARVDMLLHNASYEDFMKVDMFLLDMCDAIYMLKGWRKSCGANREYGYALAKDYIILEE